MKKIATLMLAFAVISAYPLFSADSAEAALKDIAALTATTPTEQKFTKVTAVYTAITNKKTTITTDQLTALISAANKALFNNSQTGTLSLIDQDLIRAPYYQSYKGAAQALNQMAASYTGVTSAIIWH